MKRIKSFDALDTKSLRALASEMPGVIVTEAVRAVESYAIHEYIYGNRPHIVAYVRAQFEKSKALQEAVLKDKRVVTLRSRIEGDDG